MASVPLEILEKIGDRGRGERVGDRGVWFPDAVGRQGLGLSEPSPDRVNRGDSRLERSVPGRTFGK